MAFLVTIWCDTCKRTTVESIPSNGSPTYECNDCRKARIAMEKVHYLQSLQSLTMEERLSKIESLLYDSKDVKVSHDTLY